MGDQHNRDYYLIVYVPGGNAKNAKPLHCIGLVFLKLDCLYLRLSADLLRFH